MGSNAWVIEPATSEEREWCAQLMASTDPWITLGRSLEQCRAICAHPHDELFVAHHDGRPAGFLLLRPRGAMGSPYVATLAVASEFRNRRLGSELLAFIERRCAETSRHIFMCVSSFNKRALALYERLGYRRVAELEGYVIPNASELLLYKRLKP